MVASVTPRSFFRRHAIPLVLSVVVGGLLAWVAARGGVPLVPRREAFRALEPWAIPAYLLTLVGVIFLRAARWRFLIAPVKSIPLGEVLRLNVVGTALLSRRFLGAMAARRRGRILNVASTAAFLPAPYFAAYSASKAFVLSFTEALHHEA